MSSLTLGCRQGHVSHDFGPFARTSNDAEEPTQQLGALAHAQQAGGRWPIAALHGGDVETRSPIFNGEGDDFILVRKLDQKPERAGVALYIGDGLVGDTIENQSYIGGNWDFGSIELYLASSFRSRLVKWCKSASSH